MGKATITGGGANGLYNISIKYDNARAKARLDAINSQLDQLNNTLIPQALDNKNIAQSQHQVALGYLNSYLASVTPEQFDPTISGRLTVQAMQTKSVYDEANKAYKKLLLQETALQKEKTKLQNVPEDESAQAWCADFTEDLSGDVGVIDVGYEDKDIRIIKPHAIEGAGYNAAADGIISSFFNHTAHQLYTNRAYLPAIAKWKPRYRTGSITSLDGDTCNVDLDPYVSSQQNLDINQSTSLTGVPIQYMTCNGAAFEVGDSVVVDFSLDWTTPKVVGFISNPRECPGSAPSYYYVYTDLAETIPGTSNGVQQGTYIYDEPRDKFYLSTGSITSSSSGSGATFAEFIEETFKIQFEGSGTFSSTTDNNYTGPANRPLICDLSSTEDKTETVAVYLYDLDNNVLLSDSKTVQKTYSHTRYSARPAIDDYITSASGSYSLSEQRITKIIASYTDDPGNISSKVRYFVSETIETGNYSLDPDGLHIKYTGTLIERTFVEVVDLVLMSATIEDFDEIITPFSQDRTYLFYWIWSDFCIGDLCGTHTSETLYIESSGTPNVLYYIPANYP
jgi:hypothetical protein